MNESLLTGDELPGSEVMNQMISQWTCFHLTPEENTQVIASAEVVDKGKRLVPFGLVGRLLTSRIVNKKAFMDTIGKLWGIPDLKIKSLANNQFLFTFQQEEDIQRIIAKEPWTFNRSLLLLKRFEGFNMGEVGKFNTTHLWEHTSFWDDIRYWPHAWKHNRGMYHS